jgi:acetoin utilization deacetylase AcuC-like enzyme
MKTLIVDNPLSIAHHMPEGHPEHAGRYEAVRTALKSVGPLDWAEATPCSTDAVTRFHPPEHVSRVLAAAQAAGAGLVSLDPDTHVCERSAETALAAVGGTCMAVDHVIADRYQAAFIASRPPGHHAEPDRAMGFCLFNMVALGALHALDGHGLERVAIIDIDVHHGNGTQCLAETDERVFFASIHQAPLYPGTGQAHETGLNGNIVNVPMPGGTGSTAWRAALERDVLPALRAFDPQMVFVSAGFDAHADDPVGGFELTDEDFGWVASELGFVARKHASARLVAVLEGGYDCDALGRSAACFVRALSEV